MKEMVQINYVSLIYVVVAVFGLVGFFRGWWKEGLTTVLLTILLLMLKWPNFAENLFSKANDLLAKISGLLQILLGDKVAGILKLDTPPSLDPSAYSFYIYAIIAVVIISYFWGKHSIGDSPMSWAARIIGCFMGLFNGYLIVGLVREYLMGSYLPGVADYAALSTGRAPDSITVQFTNMPAESLAYGTTGWLVLFLGIAVGVAVIGSSWTIEKFRPRRRTPPGYTSHKQMLR